MFLDLAACSLLATCTAAFPPAPAESQGMDPAVLQELDAVVQGYVDKGYAVGSELLIIKNRQTVFHKAYGMADVEAERAWEIGTICNIRSMSKPLTGVALQMLIERGEVGLDDSVSEYLEGFDNDKSREITVRQVLTHRSGLPLTILTALDEFPDLIAQANAAGERGPEFEPQSKFWYSDIGTDVVGAIVETVSGMTLDEFVQAEILDPLDMNDSFYGIDGADPRFSRIASPYLGAANAWTKFWNPADGEALYPFAWGSQTIYSTPMDYAKFLAMWMDEGRVGDHRLLEPATVRRILTPASVMSMLGSDERFPTEYRGLTAFYGMMSVLYTKIEDPQGKPVVIGHSGSDGTIAWAWPDDDLMILYYTQSRGGTTALRLEGVIDRLLIHPGDSLAQNVPAQFTPFVGTYVANFGSFENEEFEVRMKGERLALDIPSQMIFELLEPDENGARAFAIAPQVSVTFQMGDDGKAESLTLSQGPSTNLVPRKGTPLAAELGVNIVVPMERMQLLAGKYQDPESDRIIEIFIDDKGVLSVIAPPNITLQLRPTREQDKWQIRQSPDISLSFQFHEKGRVISMTRHIGDQTLVIPRLDDETDPPEES